MPQRLPLSIQDFRKIIGYDMLYVDKTEYAYKMAVQPAAYFLSQPRRFGKSITVAVLQELYSGSQELFKGLWIENKWDWNRKHPVIRISLKAVNFEQRGLESPPAERILEIATWNNITLETTAARDRFRELITVLSDSAKVVVLIDEYDAPITHYLGKDIQQATENRDYPKNFYSVLKEADRLLELVFITGVSKFSKVGIFSGLNNLVDMTSAPQFATMFGYTQEELEHNFAEHLVATAEQMKLSRAELLAQLKEWYNGYRFEEGAETVYNPVSINLFFSMSRFKNFWFETGTPTFLINFLKQEGLYNLDFTNINPLGFEVFELNNLKPVALLFQTGYLTISGPGEGRLINLDYPNKEVRDAMLEHLIEAFTGVDVEYSTGFIFKIRDSFRENNIKKVVRILQTVFKGLPYQLYEKAPERFYHAAIHLLFTYLGLRVNSEVCTSDGRADAVVETDGHIYILEFKLDKSPEVALEQIRSKKYYQAWWERGKPVVGIGIQFSRQSWNIEDWQMEEMA